MPVMLVAGDTPIEPYAMVVRALPNVTATPPSAVKYMHEPIDTLPLTKLVVKSNQVPLFTVTDVVASARPCMTDCPPKVIDALARIFPTKMLESPTVALDPKAHHTLLG